MPSFPLRAIALAVAFAAGLGLTPALADRRVALVIGNSGYKHAPRLTNTINDARAVRDKLAAIGFQVVYGENLDKRDLERAIGRFAAAVQESDVAMVYFAGHGSTFGDIPYVVPIDAQYQKIEEVPYELVQVETLVSELRRAKGVRIAILDACRDNEAEKALKRAANPTRGGDIAGGLGRIRNAEGLIIAYSTQFLTTASDGAGHNSPFTESLVANLDKPGLDVTTMLINVAREVVAKTGGSQRPEVSLSLFESYALVADKGSGAVTAQSDQQPVQKPAEPARQQAAALPVSNLGREPAEHECDRLAAHPTDKQKPVGVPGVQFEKIDRQRAVSACERALQEFPGTARFALALGRAHEASRHPEEALRSYRQAAEFGSARAVSRLINLHVDSPIAKATASETIRLMQKLADQDNVDAMAALGDLYVRGEVVAKNYSEAYRLLSRATELGSAEAPSGLGLMFSEGYGLKKDEAESIRYYRLGTERGGVSAMTRLAISYAKGLGVKRDAVEAIRLYRKAAELGGADAAYNLGIVYLNGEGVTKDRNEAIRWLRTSASLGDSGAKGTLRRIGVK